MKPLEGDADGIETDDVRDDADVWGPIASDGAAQPHLVNPTPPPPPPFDKAHCVCLRGCRYYMYSADHKDIGNHPETEGLRQYVEVNRICLVSPHPMELSAMMPTRHCNKYDPTPRTEKIEIERRREAYLLAHPGLAEEIEAAEAKRLKEIEAEKAFVREQDLALDEVLDDVDGDDDDMEGDDV